MQSDEFEWDDAKAAANVRKHKLNFRTASRVFDDPLVLIEQDDTVAYTERGDRIRIISARRANSHEQRAYGGS